MDGIFNDNRQQVEEYNEALGDILVTHEEVSCMPELYTVPADKVRNVLAILGLLMVAKACAYVFLFCLLFAFVVLIEDKTVSIKITKTIVKFWGVCSLCVDCGFV